MTSHSLRNGSFFDQAFAASLIATFGLLVGSNVCQAANVETFVLAVGGQSNYTTYGSAPAVFNFFGSGVPIPGNPAGLAASNVAGGYRHQSAASGPINDTFNVTSASFATTWRSTNQFVGSSSANAVSGKVGAKATGNFNGWGDANTVTGAESFGAFSETITFDDPLVPVGTLGQFVFRFTLDGSITVPAGIGTAGARVNYQQDSGPIYTLVNAQVDPRFSPTLFPYSGPGRAGFSLTSTSIIGSGAFDTFQLPMTWGTPTSFKLGLQSYLIPAKDAVMDVSFESSATLTGIDAYAYLLDLNGVRQWRKIESFSVDTESGAVYGPAGVDLTGIPEVRPICLVGLALGLMVCRLGGTQRRSLNGGCEVR